MLALPPFPEAPTPNILGRFDGLGGSASMASMNGAQELSGLEQGVVGAIEGLTDGADDLEQRPGLDVGVAVHWPFDVFTVQGSA